MHNSSVSIQILPLDKTGKSVLKIIDSVISLIKKSSVSYEVGPMETVMEGDLETLLEIIRQIQLLAVKSGCRSVFSNVKIIYKPAGVMTINEKVGKHRKKS